MSDAAEPRDKRFVFITPYYKEDRDCLTRCIESVRQQTVPAEHILVADGFPQAWIDETGLRHLVLDRSHRDWGNTPRAMGALMAAAEGCDGIGFLDADCWFEPDHLELCLAAGQRMGLDDCGYAFSSRMFRRPDGSVMPLRDEDPREHIDTSCFFFFPPAFEALPVWMFVPQEVSGVGDRIFFQALRERGLPSAGTPKPTVNYTCLWASLYRMIGEAPPEPLKENPDHASLKAWIAALAPEKLALVNRRLGTDLSALYHPERLHARAGKSPKAADTPSPDEDSLAQARRLFQLGKLTASQEAFQTQADKDASEDADYFSGIIQRLREPWAGVEPPSLVWRCDSGGYWELDWIRELLSGIEVVDRTTETSDVFDKHMVVCDNRIDAGKASFYREAFRRGCRVHLIHLSDEWFEDDHSCYRWCETVFRNQWSPLLARHRHVHTFPLGYKAGFTLGLVDRPSQDRAYVWSFAGHKRSEARSRMLAALDNLTPNRVHLSSGFNASDGLSQDDYRSLLQDSVFVPCPTGFSTPDTFRACEALEAGCIPILERGEGLDYFNGLYGAHPLPCVERWEQAPSLIRSHFASGDIEARRRECVAWWKHHKLALNALFKQALGGRERQQAILQASRSAGVS